MTLREKLDDWALEHVPGIIYRIPRRVGDFFRGIKYTYQKIVRKHSTSDIELWNLHSHLAKIILPKLRAFRDMDHAGYPAQFAEYSENEWKDKSEYDKFVEEGKIVGGAGEKWIEYLNEMIFGLDYLLHEHDDDFYTRWEIENPSDKVEKNHSYHYWYRDSEGHSVMTGYLSKEEREKEGYTFERRAETYYNVQLAHEYGERAQKGLQLFGEYFFNLWD